MHALLARDAALSLILERIPSVAMNMQHYWHVVWKLTLGGTLRPPPPKAPGNEPLQSLQTRIEKRIRNMHGSK